jgi:hypothetical protein
MLYLQDSTQSSSDAKETDCNGLHSPLLTSYQDEDDEYDEEI